jgi:hypothetical protein
VKAHSFLNGHEVTGDFRVGHGDRATFIDLPRERVQHGTAAANDVAETHGDERAASARRCRSSEALADPFGVPQHVVGIDGFIGADIDETINVTPFAHVEHIECSEHVGLPCFTCGSFERWHALEGCSVEDQVRFVVLKYFVEAVLVAHVAQHGCAAGAILRVDRAHQVLEQGVVAIERNQGRGLERRQLAEQFGADGAPRTGDQDARPADEIGDGSKIDVDDAPA